jgi:asparagine synthase (glutamine-hydrolysing)
MSGIVGIVNLDGRPVDRELLRQMTDFMAYRGPDAQEIWSEGSVGFGHTMLRTTRESFNEHQPVSLDGEVWITADARIDGRKELAGKLATDLAGLTDVELILHAYNVWGEKCLEHLLGDFAFAIWDGRKQRLFCARDHFGVKPFYYARAGDSFVFSNTLDCVRLHPSVSDELNDAAIGDFLLFGFNQEATTTTFADIKRLPPAHYLIWSEGVARIIRYWTLPTDGHIRYRRDDEYVEHFRELLKAAVEDRLRADNIAVSMSGGLDSTSVAAIAKGLLSKRPEPFDLRAFTMFYENLIPDVEHLYAEAAAKELGIPIHYFALDSYGLYDGWDKPELHYPEPHDYPLSAFFLDYLKRIVEHSKVMLTGDGGDPLLLFTDSYLADSIKGFRIGRIAFYMAQHLFSYKRLPRFGFRTVLRRWRGTHAEWRPPYPRWLNEDFAAGLDLQARWKRIIENPFYIHPVRPEAYYHSVHPYWPDSFERNDPGVTGILVEARYPYFDLRLAVYLLAIPPMPWFVHKEILRRAMHGILPEMVRSRPKTPLRGEPLLEIVRRSGVEGLDRFLPTPKMNKYVAREAIPRIAGERDITKLWLNIRPLSLNYWLQRHEQFEQNKCEEKYYEITR